MTALQDLGLPPTATAQQVSREFRRRARAAHPDRGGTSEQFARLHALYRAALEESHHAATEGLSDRGVTGVPWTTRDSAARPPFAWTPSPSPPSSPPSSPPVATSFAPPANSSPVTPPSPNLTPPPAPPQEFRRPQAMFRARSLGTRVRRGLSWIPIPTWVTALGVFGMVTAAVWLTDWAVTTTRHSAPRLAFPIETLFDGASEQLAPRVGAAVLALVVGWGVVLAIRPRSWRTATRFLTGTTVILLFTFGHTLAACVVLIALLVWWGRHAHTSGSKSTTAHRPTVVRS